MDLDVTIFSGLGSKTTNNGLQSDAPHGAHA